MKDMNPNSIISYEKKVKPELNKRQADVYSYIKQYPKRTISEYAELMNTTPNVISGRFKELKEVKKKIVDVGTKYIGNRPNALWQVVQPNQQQSIF